MFDSTRLFSKRIKEALSAHGAIAGFCRKTGFNRETVDRWIEGKASPTLRSMDAAADALEVKPWDLVRPDSAPDPRDEIRQAVREELAAQRVQSQTPANDASTLPTDQNFAESAGEFKDILDALKKAGADQVLAVRLTLGLKKRDDLPKVGEKPKDDRPKPQKT